MNGVKFEVGEEVKYLSTYDWETWKIGKISRFTEDGMSPVAIIWDEINGKPYVNRIPMLNKYIQKV